MRERVLCWGLFCTGLLSEMVVTCILVVDDETALVELVRGYLEREQYGVLTAADGRAALELARAAQPDLVVLDFMLPELDGIEVCRQLRQFSDAYVQRMCSISDTCPIDSGRTAGTKWRVATPGCVAKMRVVL
jgi:CheY-like chemotaxis protein